MRALHASPGAPTFKEFDPYRNGVAIIIQRGGATIQLVERGIVGAAISATGWISRVRDLIYNERKLLARLYSALM